MDPWICLIGLVAGRAPEGPRSGPGGGFLDRWRRARLRDERVRAEDVLKHLYESEIGRTAASLQSVAGATGLRAEKAMAILQTLEARNLITVGRDGLRLSPSGRELGLHVLRAHRLWESYLADRTGFPEDEWHGRAHDLEHGVSPAEVEALSARLQDPTHDPHGDPIPSAAGEVPGSSGMPLPSAPVGGTLRVVHLEDEPSAAYTELVEAGLRPGVLIRLLEAAPQQVRLAVEGAERVLAPLLAARVTVIPLLAGEETPAGEPLHALQPGEEGRILAVSRRCRGAERRRLMDLGILPGTIVRAELRSPNGDPSAYRIRDAVIALRVEQAQHIRIERAAAGT